MLITYQCFNFSSTLIWPCCCKCVQLLTSMYLSSLFNFVFYRVLVCSGFGYVYVWFSLSRVWFKERARNKKRTEEHNTSSLVSFVGVTKNGVVGRIADHRSLPPPPPPLPPPSRRIWRLQRFILGGRRQQLNGMLCGRRSWTRVRLERQEGME